MTETLYFAAALIAWVVFFVAGRRMARRDTPNAGWTGFDNFMTAIGSLCLAFVWPLGIAGAILLRLAPVRRALNLGSR